MKEFNEILNQLEITDVEHNTNYEVKEVTKQELETIKRGALSKDGKFEKFESNESRRYVEVLNEVRDKVTSIENKLDKIIRKLEGGN